MIPEMPNPIAVDSRVVSTEDCFQNRLFADNKKASFRSFFMNFAQRRMYLVPIVGLDEAREGRRFLSILWLSLLSNFRNDFEIGKDSLWKHRDCSRSFRAACVARIGAPVTASLFLAAGIDFSSRLMQYHPLPTSTKASTAPISTTPTKRQFLHSV